MGEKNKLEETGGFKKIIQDHNDRFEKRQDKIKTKNYSEMREDDLSIFFWLNHSLDFLIC